MRSLRTSVQFLLFDGHSNIISITGPSPTIGKTFVTVNLAVIMAQANKRVLLIDADLRKGYLNKYFDTPRENGLSEWITDATTKESAIRHTEVSGLDMIPSGHYPPNPSELLSSDRFRHLIEEVANANIIGRIAGVNFSVLRYGKHPLREISQMLKMMKHSGIDAKGFIFNDIPISTKGSIYGHYGNYNYHYYQYDYRNKEA